MWIGMDVSKGKEWVLVKDWVLGRIGSDWIQDWYWIGFRIGIELTSAVVILPSYGLEHVFSYLVIRIRVLTSAE